MKPIRLLAAGLFCATLGACAGTSTLARRSSGTDIDQGKVVAVNDWALHRRAEVIWIHYPRLAQEGRD